MSERRGWSRRRMLGTAVAAPLAAQHQGSTAGAVGKPAGKHQQFLSDHELTTLRLLCDLILPADDISPAASAAGAPEYIDLLCRNNEKLARIYHGGLAWLDATCNKLHGTPFRQAAPGQQTALLERLAYRDRTPDEWNAGARFFDWVRRMTLDAFYTSPIGYKDLGYKGGHGMTTFEVPEAALQQALDRLKV